MKLYVGTRSHFGCVNSTKYARLRRKGSGYCIRFSGGAVHLPSIASTFGQ
jgi:hypothetical protein